jgi:hypothetical protein
MAQVHGAMLTAYAPMAFCPCGQRSHQRPNAAFDRENRVLTLSSRSNAAFGAEKGVGGGRGQRSLSIPGDSVSAD